MHKRLTTTVEEDATARDNFAALAERRERAAAEKLQLEHKLKLQRLEQAKQTGALQVGEQPTEVLHYDHCTETTCCSHCTAENGGTRQAVPGRHGVMVVLPLKDA